MKREAISRCLSWNYGFLLYVSVPIALPISLASHAASELETRTKFREIELGTVLTNLFAEYTLWSESLAPFIQSRASFAEADIQHEPLATRDRP